MLFSLCSVAGFSKITLSKLNPILDKKDLESVQTDSIPDSTFVLSINNYVLDSIIRDKIAYFKTIFKVRDSFKNITISFQSNSHFDYIRITGNIPDCEDVKYLIGTLLIDGFRLFVHNYSGQPIDDYFHKSKSRYIIPRYEYTIMTTNTPTWYYVIRDETLEEICNENN
jgi:hypothetical protein